MGVTEGVVTLRGDARDSDLITTAARLAQAVEGVVDVRYAPSTARSGR
ncbi:BON domain-containing protein [Streptomyces sp. CBMA152]|nr:BON domain-containing protein [Streptomyces sp. CBMA152]